MKLLTPPLVIGAPIGPQLRASNEAYVDRRVRLLAGTAVWMVEGNKQQRCIRIRRSRNITVQGTSLAGAGTITLMWREGNRTFYADARRLELLPETAPSPTGRMRNSLLAARSLAG